jgi:hypothetical protein
MKNGGNTWPWHCRRFIVNALIGASTVAVMLAAIGATADVYVYMLLIPCATVLVGIGLMVEPNITARPASDIGPQPCTESNPRNPGSIGRRDERDAAVRLFP